MPCHPTVGAGRPISVIPARRDGSRDPPRCGSRAALGRPALHASGVGRRFGIDVVVVSQAAMRARYCTEGAESLGDERTAGRRGEIVQAWWEHRDVARSLRLAVLNYPRRQQYRRLSHAGAAALGSAITALFGLVAASAGSAPVSGSWSLLPPGWGSPLAAGCRSPGEVGSAPSRRTRCGVCWLRSKPKAGGFGTPGLAGAGRHRLGGDRPHRRRGRDRDEDQDVRPAPPRWVRDQAVWLTRRRRRWARNGALGVMCLVRARGVERVDEDVLVVSIDRLTHVLRAAERMCSDTTVVSSRSSPQLRHSLGDRT